MLSGVLRALFPHIPLPWKDTRWFEPKTSPKAYEARPTEHEFWLNHHPLRNFTLTSGRNHV